MFQRFKGHIVLAALFILINGAWCAVYLFCPKLHRTVVSAEISQEKGFAYTIDLMNPNLFYTYLSDGLGAPARSGLRIYENDKMLGPAHSAHDQIRAVGGGAFSHWNQQLYFSASDNTDPRSNGRKYTVLCDTVMKRKVQILFLVADVLCAGLLLFFLMREPILSFSAFGSLLLCGVCVLFLYKNQISVVSVYGRLLYLLFAIFIFFAALITFFLEQRACPPHISFVGKSIRRIQIVFAACFLAVIFLEGVYRAFPYPDTLAVNPGCRYFWKDWYRYPLNSYGYREREIGAKQKDVYRVLIYGDSYVEGAGLSRADLAGFQLEKILNERLAANHNKLRVEAFNLGHCGANTKIEVAWITKEVPLLNPDLVVLAYIPNDPEIETLPLVNSKNSLWRDLAVVLTGDHGSYFYYRLLRASQVFSMRQPGSVSSQTYIEKLHDDLFPGWLAVKEALAKFSNYFYKQRIDSMALIVPVFHAKVAPDMIAALDKVDKTMRGAGIESHNLLGFFTQDSPGALGQYAFSIWDPHPNALANKKMAEYLANTIWNRPSFRKAAGITK